MPVELCSSIESYNIIFIYLFFYIEALITLLLTLVKKCPEVCKSNHFHVLLGAYGATLSYTGKCFVCVCVSCY